MQRLADGSPDVSRAVSLGLLCVMGLGLGVGWDAATPDLNRLVHCSSFHGLCKLTAAP